MNDMSKNGLHSDGFKTVVRHYTVWFVPFCLLCLLSFFITGHKSLFSNSDGIHQQYMYFLYVGKWIRRLFGNLFVRHIFEIPMWDMSIGMGSDSLIALSAVANPLTDPFYWISAIIPQSISETAFDVILLLKLYSAGLAFAYFAFCKGLRKEGIVVGSVLYTFSPIIYIGLAQAYFLNTFYLFPLLLVGADRLWNKKGIKLYVLILAACFMYSYYFTYMMGVMVVVYCIISFIFDKSVHSVKSFVRLVLRYICCSVLGIGIGTGFQLPAVINLSGLDRLDSQSQIALLSMASFFKMIMTYFSGCSLGGDSFWGFASVSAIALISLFAFKKDKKLKALLIIFSLSFMFPAAGFVFNGFVSGTTRYVFGYLLLISYIVAYTYDAWDQFKGKLWIISTIVSVIYLVIATVLRDPQFVLSGASLVVTVLVMGLVNGNRERFGEHAGKIMTSIVFLSCLFIGYSFVTRYLLGVEVEFGTAQDYLLKGRGIELIDKSDPRYDDVRYDTLYYIYDDVPLNATAIHDLNGYDIYQSNYNNCLDRYYLDMAIVSNPIGFALNGMRGREMLSITNGTEYIIRQEDSELCINAPYSYEEIDTDGAYSLYRSDIPVSMVFLYEDTISEEQYSSLLPYEKEEILMTDCVIGDTVNTGGEIDRARYHDNIDYQITETAGIEFTDDTHFVADEDGYLLLGFDTVSDSEIGIYFDHIESDTQFVLIPILQNGEEQVKADFFAAIPSGNEYYHWKDKLLFTYGFIDGEANAIKVLFHTAGEYTLDDIRIYSRSEEQLNRAYSDFAEHAGIDRTEYSLQGNHIYADTVADADSYLYFAVPYSEGWTAYIDGEKADIIKANTAFMAVPVSQGEHKVELVYFTPYLKVGMTCSLISLIGLGIYEFCNKKKKEA